MTPGRRGLLLGLGSAGTAAAVRAATLPDNRPALPVEEVRRHRRMWWRSMVRIRPESATPQPAAALLAAFDVLADDRAELADMFRLLTERCAFLTTGGPVPELDPKLPPARFRRARPARVSRTR